MTINVTKPFLPPIEEYGEYLKGIWSREWLTNNGPLVNELELQLKRLLGLDHLLYLTNGTVALQLAIKALGLRGEVITTPFSYVATTSSLVWEGCTPVMADICPRTLNIDPDKIEEKLTEHTTAILATHVYGNPCDVDRIEGIARKHNVRVIYDAAHAFGTKVNGRSLFSYGDVSTTSFHATKLFHTIEGGAVVTPDPELLRLMAQMRNFGHVSPTEFGAVGINGKNSEMHAAMGLCNLKYVPDILAKRRILSSRYDEGLNGCAIRRPEIAKNCEYNYAYYAVVLESEEALVSVLDVLHLHNIVPRRYFFPSLSELKYVHDQSAPISEDISRRVLCLPLYNDLSFEEVDMICRLIKRALRY
ncbi:MAG: DegT/DnrJ/EryC1/StrS family aminotransferase [Desulfurellales bacterium]|uniref:DegT/DnrJ/EryC1/StrS family aminotransferase n=1 Tax=Pseudoxanthomonas mexicana TaxID=128785 RepID=UPI0011D2F5A3|nr:DegT/DnrJ/EryC1/StrS family aminotransferase [Pseudoxanthomonas mexicana]TXH58545.1 MAG: DegT/DnrJ/EryC1/StrS family aminotransferase [Desulfurellales bacterium]